MMWYWGPGYGWSVMAAGIFMMVVFWGVIIALAVILLRYLAGPRGGRKDDDLERLRDRLAAGEITSEEFERIRKVLQG